MMNETNINPIGQETESDILSKAGYSAKAINYYIGKPYAGVLPMADHTSSMTGTCGDTMKIYLKIKNDIIEDARYQVFGCPGAVAAAMAVVDIVKGKSLSEAQRINDSDVFKLLEEIPAKKHHCIQLSVKTLHQAIKEYTEK